MITIFLLLRPVQDFVKIAAMGKDFFRHKVDVSTLSLSESIESMGLTVLLYFGAQVLDAIIIVSSLIMDIVFLNGVTGEEGQKAVAILVILLLWRIARVTDGEHIFALTKPEECMTWKNDGEHCSFLNSPEHNASCYWRNSTSSGGRLLLLQGHTEVDSLALKVVAGSGDVTTDLPSAQSMLKGESTSITLG